LVNAITENSNLNYNQTDNEDKTELFYAINAGGQENIDVVEQLISKGSKLTKIYDSNGWTPLLLATKLNKVTIVESLLRRTEVDWSEEVTRQGEDSCLHLACQNGSLDMVKVLVKFDCQTDLVNRKKELPIDIARNSHEICTYLNQIAS
jgi:ankyrin repeat protein